MVTKKRPKIVIAEVGAIAPTFPCCRPLEVKHDATVQENNDGHRHRAQDVRKRRT